MQLYHLIQTGGRDTIDNDARSWYIISIGIEGGGKERSRKRGKYSGNICHFLGDESVQYQSRYNVVNRKHVSSAMPEKCNNIVARRSRLAVFTTLFFFHRRISCSQ